MKTVLTAGVALLLCAACWMAWNRSPQEKRPATQGAVAGKAAGNGEAAPADRVRRAAAVQQGQPAHAGDHRGHIASPTPVEPRMAVQAATSSAPQAVHVTAGQAGGAEVEAGVAPRSPRGINVLGTASTESVGGAVAGPGPIQGLVAGDFVTSTLHPELLTPEEMVLVEGHKALIAQDVASARETKGTRTRNNAPAAKPASGRLTYKELRERQGYDPARRRAMEERDLLVSKIGLDAVLAYEVTKAVTPSTQETLEK